MLTKVLENKIPVVWEIIKSTISISQGVPGKTRQPYFNETLHALLNGKAQCFIGTDEKQTTIQVVIITRIRFDSITDSKFLFVQALHNWIPVEQIDVQKYTKYLIEFAKSEECTRISFKTNHNTLIDKSYSLGFTETFRQFDYYVRNT